MLVPIESKQIAFCSYHEEGGILQLYYHTGEVVTYPSVGKAEYQSILDSTNRLDAIVRVTNRGQLPVVMDHSLTQMGELA
ncbi:KTSC domain-containing protein [Paenibacillus spongiae]|uniref:KTSC domain-containing protein n=1 Tax=Paenibacillus spongiae TaxID=2909671 RepID=A0ABY5SFZ4_9BACL|nr:KTSC domain-containing protein [Paenibacillus spongiae]UVI31593.1 KTSC domain-containing protein [Paenibacillus spongiae]